MAGFQKFPTPRAVHGSYWNYNPRWKVCALAYGIGSSLVTFVLFRYSLLRSVLNNYYLGY